MTIDDKEAVDKIIAAEGKIPGDEDCLKVVQYNNQFDGRLAYGLVFASDGPAGYFRYENSPACHNCVVLWEKFVPTVPTG